MRPARYEARRRSGRRAGRGVVLGFGDVPCLRTLGAVDDFEFNRLAFFQGPETVATDCGIVHEHVATTLAFNETVALGVVKPLDLTCDTHRSSSLLKHAPEVPDELPGTKKDRECLRGLDCTLRERPPTQRHTKHQTHPCQGPLAGTIIVSTRWLPLLPES